MREIILRKLIREELQMNEIFGWSRKEREAAAEKARIADLKRDAEFERESSQNEEDWESHKDFRTMEGRKEIAALKAPIRDKLMSILGPGAQRDPSGNPRMDEFTEDELRIIDRIFRVGKDLNHPWNVNPLGIKQDSFVRYVSVYMDLWKRGVQEPQRSDAAGRSYASAARSEKSNPKQGISTHPGGPARLRRGRIGY